MGDADETRRGAADIDKTRVVTTHATAPGMQLHVTRCGDGEVDDHYLTTHLVAMSARPPARAELRWPGMGWHRLPPASPTCFQVFPAHATYSSNWIGPVESTVIQIESEYLRTVTASDADRIELFPAFARDDRLTSELILALRSEVGLGFPDGKLYCEHLSVALCARLLRRYTADRQRIVDRQDMSDKQHALIIDYIHANLAGDLTLRHLASLATVSVEHFIRLFKERTGLPPHAYILRQRLEWARILLADPTLPINEIADRTGFYDRSHFNRSFRRIYGVDPSTFRARR